MAISLSPAVLVSERDLSTTIPNVSTSITGMAGQFEWGPCDYRGIVTNVRELVDTYGNPSDSNFEDWYTAYNNLQYNSSLYVVRVTDAAADKNACLGVFSTVTATLNNTHAASTMAAYIPNNNFIYSHTGAGQEYLRFFARYPGPYGNNIKVGVCSATVAATTSINGLGTGASFSEYVSRPVDNNDVVVVVGMNDIDGNLQILESYLVSTSVGAKTSDGQNNFIQEYINNSSRYIYCYANSVLTSVSQIRMPVNSLGSGATGTLTVGSYTTALDLFADPEEVDINIIMDSHPQTFQNTQTDMKTLHEKISSICSTRLDCIGVCTVPKTPTFAADPITSSVTYCNTLSSNSYNTLYANWKYQYDSYGAKYRWLPVTGDVAGVYAYTDNSRELWFAPAGFNRGIMKNTIRFAYSPNKAKRDLLYKARINPLYFAVGDGPVIFGQKTLQSKPSAFDRVSVRRLFMFLEKSIATSAKYFLFEKNTAFTRRLFKGMIDPFLADIKGREGLLDFATIVDETNNTGEVMDRNEFVADIYLKPARDIEVLKLNFIATKSGVSFSELISK